MTLSVESHQAQPGRPRRRLVRLTAAGVAVGVAVTAMVTAGGGSAGAATPISQSEGRFLTGTAAGQSFDSVAALTGEMAAYPGNPGPNQNDLAGSVLGQALTSPLGNGTVPFPGGVTFGAVGQFAEANQDGSASASSGLIGSNGAINVGGSGNSDLATIDLAGLPGATSLTNVLGDLTLTVGAISGRARQAAFGRKLADPAADCTGGTYKRVSASNHAGSYQFANLTLSATSPLLATLGTTLTTAYSTLSAGFNTAANTLPGGLISISDVPTATDFKNTLTVSLGAHGGVTASLADGSLTIDLAKILEDAGLDINNLCPNTSLGSYLTSALDGLPSAIEGLVTSLSSEVTTALNKASITIAGTTQNASVVTAAINAVLAAANLSTYLPMITTPLSASLEPAVAAIQDNLLDLTANAQRESTTAFTEAALLLTLLPNGGSLPTIPGLGALPPLPALGTISSLGTLPITLPTLSNNSRQQRTSSAKSSSATPSGSATANSFSSVKLASARLAPLAAPAATGTPALQLNLGLAAVTNNEPASATTTSTSPSAAAAGTDLPTGVPAGAAGHGGGGSPALPIVLVLIGLVLAGGGVTAYRGRGKFSH